jgi:hypothetical protein
MTLTLIGRFEGLYEYRKLNESKDWNRVKICYFNTSNLKANMRLHDMCNL